MEIRKYIRQIIEESFAKNDKITCYHRSDDLNHLMNNDFKLEYANNIALFGNAIYFSESPNISSQMGKYICKFSITLEPPILDMNKKINNAERKKWLTLFNETFNVNTQINTNHIQQFGDFFQQISDAYDWEYNKYYRKFIETLGYNSFKYFGNYHTDFLNSRGDYGLCYGIYNPKSIQFIDGPF